MANFDQVEMIRAPKVIPMAKPTQRGQPTSLTAATSINSNYPIFDEAIRRIQNGENQWGIEQIKAPRTLEAFNKGEEIVVANIDTGARVCLSWKTEQAKNQAASDQATVLAVLNEAGFKNVVNFQSLSLGSIRSRNET